MEFDIWMVSAKETRSGSQHHFIFDKQNANDLETDLTWTVSSEQLVFVCLVFVLFFSFFVPFAKLSSGSSSVLDDT